MAFSGSRSGICRLAANGRINCAGSNLRNRLLSGACGPSVSASRAIRSLNWVGFTAGGVSTAEVDPQTMQSRLVKGLYFAGELLDIDADTGGYNLQIAYSTGHLAGQMLGNK